MVNSIRIFIFFQFKLTEETFGAFNLRLVGIFRPFDRPRGVYRDGFVSVGAKVADILPQELG